MPAVVSDVGEARDVIRHGDNGFPYPPGDVVELSRRLSDLLDDERFSHELGPRAARDARAHAGAPRVAAAYRRILT
jgi:glycosyltransferase involved in cell wall biosynthesis